MNIKILTEHHLEFLSLNGGCTGSSESTLVKIPHCWKSYVGVHEVSEISENVLISGDFDYKDINLENLTTIHSEIQPEYKFIECLRDNYLFQHIRHFTRCRNEQVEIH